MDRRNRAQGAHTEIERLAAERHGRFDRYRRAIDVGDDAEAVANVERARLLRDIGAGIAQAEEGFDTVAARLGDDFAGFVGPEPVDHHAVEPEQHPQLPRGLVAERFRIGERIQTLGHGPQRSDMVPERLVVVRFGFDDQHVAGPVEGEVEQRTARRQFEGEQALGLVGIVDARCRGEYLAGGRLAERILQRLTAPGIFFQAEHLSGIGRMLGNQGVARNRKEGAERLNVAERVDRLAIAIGEVDGVGHVRHAAFLSMRSPAIARK